MDLGNIFRGVSGGNLERTVQRGVEGVVADQTGAGRGTVRNAGRGNIEGAIRGGIRDYQRQQRIEQRDQTRLEREEKNYGRAEERYERDLDRHQDNPRALENVERRFENAQDRYQRAYDRYVERHGEPPERFMRPDEMRRIGDEPENQQNQQQQQNPDTQQPLQFEFNDENRVAPGELGPEVDLEGDYVQAAASGEIRFGEPHMTTLNGNTYVTAVVGDEIASFDITEQMPDTGQDATVAPPVPDVKPDVPSPN